MTDNQRIHPVHDVEAQTNPAAPLVPTNTAKSERGDPQYGYPPPLPQRKKKRSCCCRLFCCALSTVLILILAIAITGGSLYLVFKPKLPKYSVDKLRITQFNVVDNNNLFVTFNVTVTARNPNKKIGIYYVGGSHISAWYKDTNLCEGSMPKFYQGHRNTTVLNLPLTGQTQDATGLVNSVQLQLQETGNIPLYIKVKQPVRVKLGKLKLFKVNFHVRCRLLVNNLGANNDIRVTNSSCKFRFRL